MIRESPKGKSQLRTKAKSQTSSITTNWVPSWEVPAILKGAEWAWKGAERVADWIKSEGPLSVQILDSCQDGSDYAIKIKLMNLTIHGMYLLGFDLVWPKVTGNDVTVEINNKGIIFGGDSALHETAKDTLLQPAQSVGVLLKFKVSEPTLFREKGALGRPSRLGEGSIKFWMLDKEEPSEPKKIFFALRRGKSVAS